MHKKNRLTEDGSLFSKGAKAESQAPSKQEMPKQITIREADGGYIVSSYDGNPSSNKDKVYKTVKDLKRCIEEKFGKGSETSEEE